jgi:hypothetical protein
MLRYAALCYAMLGGTALDRWLPRCCIGSLRIAAIRSRARVVASKAQHIAA